MMETMEPLDQKAEILVRALIGEKLSLAAFNQLAGHLAGLPFVKIVVDKTNSEIHFINNHFYQFHADYIAENILGISIAKLEAELDQYNQSFYMDLNRRFYLGIIALNQTQDKKFFSIETVEVDLMNAEMLKYFFSFVRDHIDISIPLLLKPANHMQESMMGSFDPILIPRIYAHEIFASSTFTALHPGVSKGRIRAFESQSEFTKQKSSIEWYDIIVMKRVPDDIPRVSGIINAEPTTPLSHTNVLAAGWQIPNCIQIGIFDILKTQKLFDSWVEYSVKGENSRVDLKKIERPVEADQRPTWSLQRIKIEEPETLNVPIMNLESLRMSDHYKFGTKAANLGEMHHLLKFGSDRLLGFYKVKRPPRPNLISFINHFLNIPEHADSTRPANEFLKNFAQVPRGIAIPFSLQQQFLETSPAIQQAIGKLKMALELNAIQTDSLCIALQQLIKNTRMPDEMRNYIDSEIAKHMSGVSTFVVRSSSNAEDLESFSAAGIYESINHITTAGKIFESIKVVWASLLSPRSVRLRQDMGISLDDSYMGVVIQEQVKSHIGGVLVTMNPMNPSDFRNVYFNISAHSVNQIVQGTELPYQYLYSTVEGGGRTLSLGRSQKDLDEKQKDILGKLAFAGRLLQSHFSPDYTFSAPVDMEWVANDEGVFILQLRPFAK